MWFASADQCTFNDCVLHFLTGTDRQMPAEQSGTQHGKVAENRLCTAGNGQETP
jgi:hypothetical protein